MNYIIIIIVVFIQTPDSSLWKFVLSSANSEVAKRTSDFGNYIKNRCFRKFLLKADYLIPCIIA